ncbi:hypothetical protein DFH09DRAFT_1372265 [Mycena vulgaris]|nr:hypothetical protein DFH09DRAFT_1372265 [Mycena vulgaris]
MIWFSAVIGCSFAAKPFRMPRSIFPRVLSTQDGMPSGTISHQLTISSILTCSAFPPSHTIPNSLAMDVDVEFSGNENVFGTSAPGPYFAHDRAKPVQRDYRDVDGSLIAPHELYEKLTAGTLVFVMISLATYVITDHKMTKGDPIPDKKIYHVLVDRLKILDRGDGQPWAPAIPTIPERRYFFPGSPAKKRARDSAADAAFDNFGSRVASSPSKKSKPK